jgi:hypothetical protein
LVLSRLLYVDGNEAMGLWGVKFNNLFPATVQKGIPIDSQNRKEGRRDQRTIDFGPLRGEKMVEFVNRAVLHPYTKRL